MLFIPGETVWRNGSQMDKTLGQVLLVVQTL